MQVESVDRPGRNLRGVESLAGKSHETDFAEQAGGAF